MFRSRLPRLLRRSFTLSARTSRVVDLVCPICFDFGYKGTSLRGTVGDEGSSAKKTARLPSSTNKKLKEGEGEDEGAAQASLAEVATSVGNDGGEPEPLVAGMSQTTTVTSTNTTENDKKKPLFSLLAKSDLMRHKDENRNETIYSMLMDVGTVEPIVKDLIDGKDRRSDEEWPFAFAKAELIKNSVVPFKYWLEQPCAAHRGDDNNNEEKEEKEEKGRIAPCVAIRRGLHDYMMETNPEYAAKQHLMDMTGYVMAGGGSNASNNGFQIGHLEAGETQASGWSVEGFVRDSKGIPSPWRHPWYPDQGFVITQRPTASGDTASDEAFQKAAAWFKECSEKHPACSTDEIPFLPDRVLDIEAADTASGVRLVLTNGQRGRYACLSHRWGGETPCTTGENIDALQKEVPWHLLSPTYQDGVTFLRKFSKWHQEQYGEAIRYFWIDSLCILQDSTEDWRDHSTKMSDIYSKSAITLVESFRRGDDKRLFQKSSEQRDPKSITVHDADGNAVQVFYRHMIHHPDFMITNDSTPIWTRAWVFQERLLSPRLLIFGAEELSWQCSGHNRCECGVDESIAATRKLIKEWEDNIFHVRPPTASSRKNLSLILGESPSYARLRMAWRLMVEAYSRLQFTYRQDTMYAIAGLAKNFNLRLGGKKYFAGIWYHENESEEVVEVEEMGETTLDLLWRLAYRRDSLREDLPEPAVPITWSWACPECPIVYPFVNDEALDYYSVAVSVTGAIQVQKLPEDHDAPRHWLDDMYKEVPPSAILVGGPVWRTEMKVEEMSFKTKTTEDKEYLYRLGEMSATVYQEIAFGRSVHGVTLRMKPPAEEGESEEDTFNKMPPITFYPDSYHTPIEGPMFCMPIAKFRHLPVKHGLEEKVMFAALVLEAVGHSATTEGFDPDLESKKPEELVFRRLGLAYTTDGGWTEEHDGIIERCGTMTAVRIV